MNEVNVLPKKSSFGLPELLYKNGKSGGFKSEFAYLAKDNCCILAIHAKDLMEIMPPEDIKKLME